MAQSQPDWNEIKDCIDIFTEIKSAQWLLKSMMDAVGMYWGDPTLLDRLTYLLYDYSDKMEKLVPDLNEAFEKLNESKDVNRLWKEFMEDKE